MMRLDDDDRAEVELLADFLRRIGGSLQQARWDPEVNRRFREWLDEDPVERRRWLGFPPDAEIVVCEAETGRDGE